RPAWVLGVGEAGVRRATAPPPSAPPTRSGGPALDPRDCRGAMRIAARPGARGPAFSPLRVRSGAHVGPLQQKIRRFYSIKLKLLFTKIEHFSDRFQIGR